MKANHQMKCQDCSQPLDHCACESMSEWFAELEIKEQERQHERFWGTENEPSSYAESEARRKACHED